MLPVVIAIGLVTALFLAKKLGNPNSLNNDSPTQQLNIDLSRHTHVDDFEVVGVHLPDRRSYISNFVQPKHPVELKPELTNKFSDRALAVYYGSYQIGYIAERNLHEVHQLIEKDHTALIKSTEILQGRLYVWISLYFTE